MPNPIPMRPDPHAPRTSWWVGLSREQHAAKRAEREPAMRNSLTARKVGSMIVGSGPAVTGGRGK